MACSCRTPKDNVKSVISVDTTRGCTTDNLTAAEIAVKRLQLFYSGESEFIPKKVKVLYERILAGNHDTTKEIVIRLCKLGESGTEYLCKILPFYSKLRSLTLWKTHLNASAVERLCSSLAVMQHLKVLGLEDNGLKDDSILWLCRTFKLLKSLKELWLSSNEVTAGGAQMLSTNLADLPELLILNLDFNYIRSEGCVYLCKALIARRRLNVLSLRGNLIGHSATSDIVTYGTSNPPVQQLDLQSNLIPLDDCETLKAIFGEGVVLLAGQREKGTKE